MVLLPIVKSCLLFDLNKTFVLPYEGVEDASIKPHCVVDVARIPGMHHISVIYHISRIIVMKAIITNPSCMLMILIDRMETDLFGPG